MPKKLAELVQDWTNIAVAAGSTGGNGQFFQGDFLKKDSTVVTLKGDDNQKLVIESVAGGICHALCLRFVENRMLNFDAPTTFENIKSAFQTTMLQQSMYEKGKKAGDVAGGVQAKKSGGGLQRAFSSRLDLVLKVTGQPGLYICSIGNLSSGHSMAFDTRSGFHFFDPNSGFYNMDKFDSLFQLKAITQWIYDYWETLGYKGAYGGVTGWRELLAF
jgi:hypothetical protein